MLRSNMPGMTLEGEPSSALWINADFEKKFQSKIRPISAA
jgi:hypothetical protein